MDVKKNLKDKVEAMSTRVFTISGMPEKDFQRFLRFCESNAKATKIFYSQGKRQVKEELIYSIAIKQLLDAYEAEAKVQMLYDKIIQLEEKVNNMKVKSDDKEDEPLKRKIISTMGPKGD